MESASKAGPGTLRGWLDEQFGDLLWQLSNFWFGMTLLGIWGFMTLLGVVIDQGKDPPSSLAPRPPPPGRAAAPPPHPSPCRLRWTHRVHSPLPDARNFQGRDSGAAPAASS